MIAFALKLLTSRAAGPIASVLAVLLLSVAGCQTVRLHSARADLVSAEEHLASAREQLSRCQSNRKALEASITEQNAEVDAFARIQAGRVAAAEKVAQLAAKGRVDAELRAAKLLKSQPQGVDACARFSSADRLVLESLR